MRATAGSIYSDEAALLAGLRAGEDAAFDVLVRSYAGRLLGAAQRLLRNEDDAQDAVQDAFLSAFRSIDSFKGDAQLSTWLHRIVVNAALMKLRSRRRKPEEPIDDLLPRFLADGHPVQPAAPWREPADKLIQQREVRDLVRACIDQLPETHRTVLMLRDVEELDTEETARTLGISVGAVKTRLHRARQALRELLDPHLRRGET